MSPSAPTSSAPRRKRFESRFNDSDRVVWNIERDPSLRATIVAIAQLLDQHRPSPAQALDEGELPQRPGRVEGRHRDRGGQLEDGVGHHVFTDVVGGVRLAEAVVDDQREPRRRRGTARDVPPPAARPGGLLAGLLDAARDSARDATTVDKRRAELAGIDGPVYLAGAGVLRHAAFPSPSGASLGIALSSHEDVACIGVTIDTAAVPDPDVLIECLEHGFADVLAVAPAPSRRSQRPAAKAG